jgi:hypothetical protein
MKKTLARGALIMLLLNAYLIPASWFVCTYYGRYDILPFPLGPCGFALEAQRTAVERIPAKATAQPIAQHTEALR